jgi:hypothetical protein
MIHLKLKSSKEGINYSKFWYLSKIMVALASFSIVAFTTHAEDESVLGIALSNTGLDTYGLDDEC